MEVKFKGVENLGIKFGVRPGVNGVKQYMKKNVKRKWILGEFEYMLNLQTLGIYADMFQD